MKLIQMFPSNWLKNSTSVESQFIVSGSACLNHSQIDIVKLTWHCPRKKGRRCVKYSPIDIIAASCQFHTSPSATNLPQVGSEARSSCNYCFQLNRFTEDRSYSATYKCYQVLPTPSNHALNCVFYAISHLKLNHPDQFNHELFYPSS